MGKITGAGGNSNWAGLEKKDYSHIIDNSTTRYVEYLIDTYGKKYVFAIKLKGC